MAKRIVTISREFGSGGRSVAKAVATQLGYTYCDEEIIDEVMEKSGLSELLVKRFDEYATRRSGLLYAIDMSAGSNMHDGTGLSFAARVQLAQAEVIESYAQKGNCVIVGRGADYVLRDREDCLHVFIHANMKYRADRIVRLYGERDKKPMERLEDKDERRKLYYKSLTMREWGVCQNYHVSLDSSVVGLDNCTDIITKLVKSY